MPQFYSYACGRAPTNMCAKQKERHLE